MQTLEEPTTKVLIVGYSTFYDDQIFDLCEEMKNDTLAHLQMNVYPDLVLELIRSCKDYGFGLVVDDVLAGMIGGILTRSMTNGEIVLQEIIWYVRKGYRQHSMKLLEAFEMQALVAGAKGIVMTAMAGPEISRLDRFYKRRGYREIEVQYYKEIPND